SFCDIKEVRETVEKAVLFYNTERPHMSINMMTPQEASHSYRRNKEGWTSYRDIAIKNLQTEKIITNKCLSLGA
ncbi:Integrase catalytic region, partial [gut metagenome]